MTTPANVGTIAWVDLTVPDAPAIRDFYQAVTGWSASEVPMGDYSDFSLAPGPDAAPVAGICHARGVNAELPAQWLVYIIVADLDVSIARCLERGGEVLVGPKSLGGDNRYCVIRDPAGAVAALFAGTTTQASI